MLIEEIKEHNDKEEIEKSKEKEGKEYIQCESE